MFRAVSKVVNQQAMQLVTLQAMQAARFSVSEAKLMDRIKDIQTRLESERNKVLQHPLYKEVKTLNDIKIFMQHHVFAVYDFMNLLKKMQMHFANFDLPWLPQPDKAFRRAINEILLEEETDPYSWGWEGEQYASHFEMYMDAIIQADANIKPIYNLFNKLKQKQNVFEAIKSDDIPKTCQNFMEHTFKIVEEGKLHKIAAATTIGREDINHFPVTFLPIVKKIAKETPNANLSKFVYYWECHANHGTEHGPKKYLLIQKFCGEDDAKWKEVETSALSSIKQRVSLWDGMLDDIRKSKK